MHSLSASLRSLIPEHVRAFDKLTDGREPYHFEKWETTIDGDVLHYWFSGKTLYHKVVHIQELEAALRRAVVTRNFSRDIFNESCPKTKYGEQRKKERLGGDCGYAVMGRCLEELGVAKQIKKWGKGFKILNDSLVQSLLD